MILDASGATAPLASQAGATGPGLEIELIFEPRISSAMFQNRVPVVRRLAIRNAGASALVDLEVRLRAEVGIATTSSVRLARLDPGHTHSFEGFDLALDPRMLAACEERQRGTMEFEVYSGSERVAARTEPLEIYAHNEWAGVAALPELLAAFVQPNHPAIVELLKLARESMRTWTGDPSLEGYQSRDPERVRQMAAAVYSALQARGITYVNPPASFERLGQKVRNPGQILTASMGTCLDLTVIAAACMEAMGLHPLLFIMDGHAFCGAWLEDSGFPEPTIDEALAIRKRIELGEIVVFDPTLATRRPVARFEDSEREGVRQLGPDSRLMCAVDVHCARRYGAGIRPLATGELAAAATDTSSVEHALAEDIASGPRPSADLALRRRAVTTSRGAPSGAAGTVEARLDSWRAKLLDLSKRNRLLRYKETRASVPLMVHDAGAVEDVLASGKRLQVLSKPDLRTPDGRAVAAADQADISAHLASELSLGRVRSMLPAGELGSRLVELYRKARTSLEEGGANTLFLAVGFLEWFDAKSSSDASRAPILLLPIELHRERVGQPMQVGLGSDEPMLNITLLEKLRVDFGLNVPELYELPTDESGLDIPLILRRFREAVRDQPRWSVVDDVHISVFTFAKFLMWSDLTNRIDAIRANEQVAAILSGRPPAVPRGAPALTAETLDRDVHPAAQFCPLDADSTQLEAVHAAAAGRSFVLEGPPGTGKSQTITNLITQCLAQGKRVLFVSEKIAALQVVHSRLEKVGLGPFCLELHSNSASKQKVVEEFKSSLQHASAAPAAEWRERTGDLASTRADLNRLADAVGRSRPIGLNVFEVTSRLVGLKDAPQVAIGWKQKAAETDAPWRRSVLEAAAAFQAACEAIGPPASHPWRATEGVKWHPGLEADAGAAIQAAGKAATLAWKASEALGGMLGFDASGLDGPALAELNTLTRLLVDCPSPPRALATARPWAPVRDVVRDAVAVGRKRDAAWVPLADRWGTELLKQDIRALLARYRRWAHAFALFAFFALWGARRVLRSVAKGGQLPSRSQTLADLGDSERIRDFDSELQRLGPPLQAALGPLWNGPDSNWDKVEGAVAWLDAFGRSAQRLGPLLPAGILSAVSARLVQLTTDGVDSLGADMPQGQVLRHALMTTKAWDEARAALARTVGLSDGAWPQRGQPYFQGAIGRLMELRNGLPRLREWSQYRMARSHARALGLAPLVDGVELGQVPGSEASRAADRALHHWWLSAVMRGEPVLSDFSRATHERRIAHFRELDRDLLELSRAQVRAAVARQIPPVSAPRSDGSELTILLRELQKKRGHRPLRKLFQEIPTLLGKLKPCLLMSPLSVAQYLDPAMPPFDVVVFDEASQIPAWDAIGAVARGQQLVVVGDPKQLPPTNFFQKMESDELIDDNGFDELESILDECLASGMDRRHLGWHYRSRHESLIAFSNYHYYEGRLLTFPNSEAQVAHLGVSWRHVPEGHYDRGKTRTNLGEARALVAELVRRLRDPSERERSIGVVTFSTAQQALLEDLLDKARQQHPEIEPYFQDSRAERVFVKNLESVQGDERDVIMFSICYGRDAAGQIVMNFGPLNRDGGERRLNVAITRAREQVVVFSSLTPDDIDLRKTSAVAIKHLADFLRYADQGPRAIDASAKVRGGLESPFEAQVYDALTAKGWDVDTQVGCSGYRIDMAVRDPKLPGRYLLGVECDGAMYHSSRNARDRDRLRQQVLEESYGWTLHRIWSTDWWQSPDAELARLEDRLERARLAPRAPTPAAKARAAAQPTAALAGPEPEWRPYATRPASEPPEGLTDVVAQYLAAPDIRDDPSSLAGAAEYVAAALQPESWASPETFQNDRVLAVLAQHVKLVVRTESPVHIEVVARRLMAAWGVARLTKNVRSRVTRAVAATKPGEGDLVARGQYLWTKTMVAEGWTGFRFARQGDADQRDAGHIAPEEVANAARAWLEVHRSLNADAFAVDLARLFGFAHTGSKVRGAMEAGIDQLVNTGRATRRDDAVDLNS